MFLLLILSNKLDFNQETHFTILVYCTSCTKVKVKRRDFSTQNSNQDLNSLTLNSISKRIFSNTSCPMPTQSLEAPVSTSKMSRTFNHLFKATITLQIWQGKFKPTPTSPWRQRSWSFQTSMEIRPRTPLRPSNSWPVSMNDKSPTSGTTSRNYPTSGSRFADKRTNGSVLWSVIFNLRFRRKHGLASDRVSKQNSLHFWMTNSSSTVLPTYLTGLVKSQDVFLTTGGTHLCPQGKLRLLPCQTRQASSRGCRRLFWRFAHKSNQRQCGQLLQLHVHPDVPENVRRLLSHKDQTRLTVEDAYKIYFTNCRLAMDKKSSSVHAINEGSDNGCPLSDRSTGCRGFQTATEATKSGFSISIGHNNRSNYNKGNRQNYNQSNQPKSNTSRNSKFCV